MREQPIKRGRQVLSEVWHDAAETLQDVVQQAGETVAPLTSTVASSVKDAAGSVAETVQGVVQQAGETVQQAREDQQRAAKQAGKTVRRGAKTVSQKTGRELRALRAESAATVAQAHKRAEQSVGRLEAQAAKSFQRQQQALTVHDKQLRDLNAKVDRLARSRRGGSGGGLLWLLALLGGVYYLARNPGARKSVLDAVGSVSPQARDALHGAGESLSQVIGSVWIEQDEPEGTSDTTASGSAKTGAVLIQPQANGK